MVVRLEKDAWSVVQWLRQATNEFVLSLNGLSREAKGLFCACMVARRTILTVPTTLLHA